MAGHGFQDITIRDEANVHMGDNHYHGANEFVDMLEWLFPGPYDHRHNEVKRQRLKGTGNWLLETSQYKRWRYESDSQSFLWCHGGPGTGKTVLTSLVVDELLNATEDEDISVAYIYLDYADRQAQTIESVVASLVKQLSSGKRGSEDLKRLYEQCQRGKLRPDITKLSTTLQAVCNRFNLVFFVFDALDECEDKLRTLLLSELQELDRSICKFFLTSRPHLQDMKKKFRNYPQLVIRGQESDIKLLILEKIENGESMLSDIVEGNEYLTTEIVNRIAKSAKDMFLLAALQLDAISQSTTEKQVKQKLEQMPSDLDDSYDQTIERINQQPKDLLILAHRILLWLSQARRPLSSQELCQAVSVEAGDTDLDKEKMPKEAIMVRVCLGLIVVDHDASIIRLVHFSVQEYLQKHVGESNSRLMFANKVIMAKACLTVLLFDEFGTGQCELVEAFEERKQKYPILSYVTLNLPYHTKSESKVSNEIRELTLQFLKDRHKVASAAQFVMTSEFNPYRNNARGFSRGFTGLHMAAYYGLDEGVESLLTSNERVNNLDGWERTPILWAAERGNETVIKLLLEKGAEIECKDNSQSTPLILAAIEGHEGVVRLLLARGAKLEAKDDGGTTPLAWAANAGHEGVVKLLLAKGADLEAKDELGRTPLAFATVRGYEGVVKLLLAKGVELEAKDNLGMTPLAFAASTRHEGVVKLLLAKGAELEARDESGMTPLANAANTGHEGVVKLLLARGADLEAKDELDMTPLANAANTGHEGAIKLLLAKGADLEAKDVLGTTPLANAAAMGHKGAVKLLLAKGADLEAKDELGRTPLAYAAARGHKGVVKLLSKKALR